MVLIKHTIPVVLRRSCVDRIALHVFITFAVTLELLFHGLGVHHASVYVFQISVHLRHARVVGNLVIPASLWHRRIRHNLVKLYVISVAVRTVRS